MSRLRTTIGRGPFGRPVDFQLHAWEIFQRILSSGRPLTEDAIFLVLYTTLHPTGSEILKQVRVSTDIGGYKYFSFSPDIDLLEVRRGGLVIGYELKGYVRRGRTTEPPLYYEGVDQALAYLLNPVSSPISQSFFGSIFDMVYLVHPEGSRADRLADLLQRCTPLGLKVIGMRGIEELVEPKPNPYLSHDLKRYFLNHLQAFQVYREYRLNLIQ